MEPLPDARRVPQPLALRDARRRGRGVALPAPHGRAQAQQPVAELGARVLDESDPSYDKDKDYAWQTAAWMEKSAAEAAREIARLTAANEFEQEKINDFCAANGHAFTEGIPPYLCVRVFLWDPMHMDNNLAGSLVEQYNKLAEEMGDKLKVVKLNTQDNPDVPAKYGIVSIPTFLVLKGGEVQNQVMGAQPYDQLKAAVEPHLG